MAFLTWSKKYSVGVKVMDEQHRAMIEMLNDLHKAMMENQGLKALGPLLNKLVDYTKTHLSAEESLMRSSGFPDLEAHCARHRELIAQVDEHLDRFKRDDLFQPIQLLHFLREWLSTHIQKEDREYGPWMNKHGEV